MKTTVILALIFCINIVSSQYSCIPDSMTIDPKCGGCIITNGLAVPNICSNCTAGYYLNPALCTSCPTGCSVCSTNGICTTAKSGYTLNTYNGSVTACPANCATCTFSLPLGSSGNLLSSATLYNPLNLSTATSGKYLDNTIASLYCTAANSGYRLYDYQPYNAVSGYLLTIRYILACPANCLTCNSDTTVTATVLATSTTKCDTFTISGGLYVTNGCASGYYADSTGVCYALPTVAGWVCNPSQTNAACLTDAGTNRCLAPGYLLTGSTTTACAACSSNCATCTSATVCTKCIFGYGLDSVTTSGTTVCKSCSTITTGCNVCNSLTAAVGGAVTVVCTGCSIGYAYANNTCTACPSNCAQCSANGATCSQCISGYGLLAIGTCLKCNDTNCASCDSTPNNQPYTICKSCNTGYYLPPNQCQQCPYNCSNCVNSTYCLANCTSGYGVYNSTSGLCLFSGAERIILSVLTFIIALFYVL